MIATLMKTIIFTEGKTLSQSGVKEESNEVRMMDHLEIFPY